MLFSPKKKFIKKFEIIRSLPFKSLPHLYYSTIRSKQYYTTEACEDYLGDEEEKMKSFSFYKFVNLSNKLPKLKDDLNKIYKQLGVVGRIYISSQGINGIILQKKN